MEEKKSTDPFLENLFTCAIEGFARGFSIGQLSSKVDHLNYKILRLINEANQITGYINAKLLYGVPVHQVDIDTLNNAIKAIDKCCLELESTKSQRVKEIADTLTHFAKSLISQK